MYRVKASDRWLKKAAQDEGDFDLSNDNNKGERMEKKMVIRMVGGYEGRSDLIFNVNPEEMRGLADQLLQFAEFPEDDMPKLKVEMFTPEQVAEAERIGAEMA